MNHVIVLSAVASLLILLAAVPGVDAALVAGGDFRIRGLRHPAGRQSLMLRAVVSPTPAKRTIVDATLTIGGEVVSLRASVGRSGRLAARRSRVDLTGVLPDFGIASLSLGPPVNMTIAFDASACLLGSAGRTLDCPPHVSTAAPSDGVYDAVAPGSPHAVAFLQTTLAGEWNLSLLLNPLDSLMVMAAPAALSWALDGVVVLGGDALYTASGTATVDREASGWRVDGSVSSAGVGSTYTFALERPDAGTPAELGGSWVVSFDGDLLMPFTGEATLDLTVPPDGFGSTALSTVVVGGMPLYTLGTGICLIAPAGAMSCTLPMVPLQRIVMQGTLDADAGTGGGSFYVGLPPTIYSGGSWTGRR